MNGHYIVAILFSIAAVCFTIQGVEEYTENKAEDRIQEITDSYQLDERDAVRDKLSNELKLQEINTLLFISHMIKEDTYFLVNLREAGINDAALILDLTVDRVNRRLRLIDRIEIEEDIKTKYKKTLESLIDIASELVDIESGRKKKKLL